MPNQFTYRTGRVRFVVAPRPDVPAAACVMNAPRPLYGNSMTLHGPEGMFTVWVDPASEDAAWQIERNRSLDACTVVFIDKQTVLDLGVAHFTAITRTQTGAAALVRALNRSGSDNDAGALLEHGMNQLSKLADTEDDD